MSPEIGKMTVTGCVSSGIFGNREFLRSRAGLHSENYPPC